MSWARDAARQRISAGWSASGRSSRADAVRALLADYAAAVPDVWAAVEITETDEAVVIAYDGVPVAYIHAHESPITQSRIITAFDRVLGAHLYKEGNACRYQ